jgi:hypothetical protein
MPHARTDMSDAAIAAMSSQRTRASSTSRRGQRRDLGCDTCEEGWGERRVIRSPVLDFRDNSVSFRCVTVAMFMRNAITRHAKQLAGWANPERNAGAPVNTID